MNQEQNNFNNNQVLQNVNTNQQQNYNLNNNTHQMQSKKKKLKWWIPVIFFVTGFITTIVRFIIDLMVSTGEIDGITTVPILFNQLLGTIGIISWLLTIPSLVVVLIVYFVQNNK